MCEELFTTHVLFCDRFEQVPLVTPNGDVLVRDLNFEVSCNIILH